MSSTVIAPQLNYFYNRKPHSNAKRREFPAAPRSGLGELVSRLTSWQRRRKLSRGGVQTGYFNSKPASSLAYQIMALCLITAGIILVFQNFGESVITRDIIAQAKDNIANLKENRIEADLINLNRRTQPIISVTPVVAQTVPPSKKETPVASSTPNPAATTPKLSPKLQKLTTTPMVIKAGDTLSAIALQSNLTVSELQQLNNLSPESKIRIGDKLKVPVNNPKISPSSTPKPSPAKK